MLLCKEDTTTISSAERVEEVTFAELLEAVNEVKLKTSKTEWNVEESTEDGEFLGWDTNLEDELSEDPTDGEQPEESEELLEEEELLEGESSEEGESSVVELSEDEE